MANGFTQEQTAWIEKVAWQVADAMIARQKGEREAELRHHTETCPVGKQVGRWRNILIGVAIGVGLVTGGSAPYIVKAVFAAVP